MPNSISISHFSASPFSAPISRPFTTIHMGLKSGNWADGVGRAGGAMRSSVSNTKGA